MDLILFFGGILALSCALGWLAYQIRYKPLLRDLGYYLVVRRFIERRYWPMLRDKGVAREAFDDWLASGELGRIWKLYRLPDQTTEFIDALTESIDKLVPDPLVFGPSH